MSDPLLDASAPLAGLIVVDLCDQRAGSVAGMLLADLGASVTRVQARDGWHVRPDPTVDPDFVCWDRGKHSLTVDSIATGDEVAGLLQGADIVIVDDTPASNEKSRWGTDRLNSDFPQLVVVWLPPYGARGRLYRDLVADPLLIGAMSGFAMYQPAFKGDVPIAPVVPVVEYIQGSLAASAALAGVLERVRSGVGQVATVSGVDAVGTLIATLVNEGLDTEVFRPGRNPEMGPSFRSYRCGDGEMLFLATLVAPLFLKALDVLDSFDVMLLPGVDGEYLHLFMPALGKLASEMLEAKFATEPRQHWLDLFEAAGVPAEPVQSREAWVVDDKLVAVGGRRQFEHPLVGTVDTPSHPVRLAARGGHVEPSTAWPLRGGDVSSLGPLARLRVIDMANYLAGPLAPALMAFWGAEVVKIESVDGDPYRLYTISYLAVNQCKKSVVLDVRKPEGRARFEALLAGADVLVDNFRPSAREALHLFDSDIAAINPTLVHARVTAFGELGGDGERPGFDPSIQALSGMMVATGGVDTPLNTTTPVHDVASGCSLLLGVLAALWHRANTGVASMVTGSLASASLLLQCAELTDFAGRPACATGGIDFVGGDSRQRFYEVADGWIALSAGSDETLAAAFVALGSDGPLQLDREAQGPTALAFEAAVADRTASEVVGALTDAGVPATSVVGSTWGDDEQLGANHLSHVLVDPTFGRCRVMRGPGSFSRSAVTAATQMSNKGADTEHFLTMGWAGGATNSADLGETGEGLQP
jgi:crotonobetainyl-CoA:carnitine CoA-transferase CaiB-like acyl-CoA transferase